MPPVSTPIPVQAPAVPKKKRHRFGRFLLWFFGILLFFELGLRLFGYGSYVIYRPDQQLLWVPTPGSNRITETNHLPITISADGFRYPETLGPKQGSQYRIMSFGDSVTMGWGVDDNSHYSAILEKLLNSGMCSRTKFQVVDAGVNAYPNALVVERMKKAITDGYQPDAVVITYSFNTGFEQLAKLEGKEREKLLHRVEMKSMARRSALYTFLIEDLLREVMYYRFRELLIQGSWDTAKQHQVIDVPQFTAGLNQAKQVTDANHVQLILLLLGSEGEVTEQHPYQKAMLEFARQNHVPIVDMIEVVKSQDQKAIFLDHVHPTAAGHALIAQQLATAVRGFDSYNSACNSEKSQSVISKQ